MSIPIAIKNQLSKAAVSHLIRYPDLRFEAPIHAYTVPWKGLCIGGVRRFLGAAADSG